jgi:hypothetical protein
VAAKCCRGWCSGARRKFRYFFEQLVVPFSADQDIELRLDMSSAVKTFDAKPFMHLLNAADLMPGNASRTYLEVERE